MRRHGSTRGPGAPWPGPAAAERLLDGLGDDAAEPAAADLALVLAAAARPLEVRPGDEAAALSAFREARGPFAGRAVGSEGEVRGPGAGQAMGSDGEVRGPGAGQAVGPEGVVRVPGAGWMSGRVRIPDRVRASRAGQAVRAVRAGRSLAAGGRGRRRGLTVKALAGGAAAVLALGGVAIAAQGGGLPRPFHHHHGHAVTPRPHTTEPVVSPSAVAPRPTVTHAEPPVVRGGSTSGAPPATPRVAPTRGPSVTAGPAAAGLKGLCGAYLRDLEGAPGSHALDGASLTRLARAAGGAARVPAYCAALTHTSPPLSLSVTLSVGPTPTTP